MKNWVRIMEAYDGSFTEMYLDLYNIETGFVIKGTSYHYNAGAEKMLCEVQVPGKMKTTNDILNYIIENQTLYPWAKITPEDIRANKPLIDFIKENG